MQLLAFLVAGANGPFTIAVSVALLFTAVQASGLMGLLGGNDDHDHDHDGAADGDADGDGDADADGEADHDGDHDGDHDDDHDGGDDDAGMMARVVGPLGVGKIPLSFIWPSYLMTFGITGLVANSAWVGQAIPLWNLAWTLPLGLVLAYAVVAVVAHFLTPILATKEQEATTTAELSGLEGVVISRAVTPEFGEIRIRDRSGHVLRLPCRLVPGHPTVSEGQSVVVVGKEGAWLKVVPFDVDPPRLKSARGTTEKG